MILDKTAILIVDIQNDFCDERGAFAKMGLNIKNIQKMTPKLINFIEKARKANLKIIYSKQIESDEVSPENLKAIFKQEIIPVCSPNSWGSEFYKINPNSKEIIIEKYTYDVFSNPKLENILRENKIKDLIICGVTTDLCIDSTVRSAFTKGYNIIIPKDLIATVNQKIQKPFLKTFGEFLGTVIKSKDLIKLINSK